MKNENTLRQFSAELLKIRKSHKRILPVKTAARRFINELFKLLFPQYTDKVYYSPAEIESEFNLLCRDLRGILISLIGEEDRIDEVCSCFMSSIPEINRRLWADAEAICAGDPAAENVDEVILAYPGFTAITIHRFAHELYLMKVPILPRLLSEYAHHITGVDIHPGAQIGERFCIDHGTGIVIGETAVIGSDVKIYQGVTLGALSVEKRFARKKRHPSIEDNVVVYSNATILGGETVIGRDSIIGGNTWITRSIPANSLVYHSHEVKVRSGQSDDLPPDFVI